MYVLSVFLKDCLITIPTDLKIQFLKDPSNIIGKVSSLLYDDTILSKYFNEFNEYPTHLSLLSYDLVGLVYYLSLEADLSTIDKLFRKKNSFKGKIGIFDIKNNKINHRLNFYKIENKKLIEIF